MVLVVSEWPRLPVWAGADGIAEGRLYRKCLIKKKKKGGCVCGRSGTLCREPPARAEGGFPAGDRELASLGKVRVSAGWLTDCLASTC